MAGTRQKTCFDPSAPGFSGVLITEPSSFLILSPSTVTFTIKGMVAQVVPAEIATKYYQLQLLKLSTGMRNNSRLSIVTSRFSEGTLNTEVLHLRRCSTQLYVTKVEPLEGEYPVNSDFLVALLPDFPISILFPTSLSVDIPAVHSDTQELPAGTFTALITGLFVGHPPGIRRVAPALH